MQRFISILWTVNFAHLTRISAWIAVLYWVCKSSKCVLCLSGRRSTRGLQPVRPGHWWRHDPGHLGSGEMRSVLISVVINVWNVKLKRASIEVYIHAEIHITDCECFCLFLQIFIWVGNDANAEERTGAPKIGLLHWNITLSCCRYLLPENYRFIAVGYR